MSKLMNNIYWIALIVAALLFISVPVREEINMRQCEREYTGCELLKCKAKVDVSFGVSPYELQYTNCLLEKQINQ